MKNILQTGDGEKLFVLTDLITIKVSAKDTANHYSVIEEIVLQEADHLLTGTPK